MSERRYLTVTALTRYLKKKFEIDPHLQDIWLRGELSNFKAYSRGHMYFTIKDENARLQAVMFAGNARTLNFKPTDGMKVLVRGQLAVYEPSGSYQMYVKDMQQDGIGNLYLAYEEMKRRLEKEGLFSDIHKKAIPKFPNQIGVITSPTGAAIRDIITTIKRRYPVAKIIILPALVQGVNAAPSIVKAIQTANRMDSLDVLIVGRGGGSIEELWAFNEESVAREIFASRIPIISAVGHETDFTIADFVADLRAPTPTGAAEMAVPHIKDLMDRISVKKTRIHRAMKKRYSLESGRLDKLQKSYAFRYPKNLHAQKEQQLDRIIDRLQRAGSLAVERKKQGLNSLSIQLKANHPAEKIKKASDKHQHLLNSMERQMQGLLKEKAILFASTVSKLEALSPLKIMERGFSLVYNEDKKLVKSVQDIQLGESITVQLKDGQLDCRVAGAEERNIDE